MFFWQNESNIILEEHKSPIKIVFLLGGLGGFLAVAHYIFFVVEQYDNLRIAECLISGWCYTGILSVGVFRSFQYLFEGNKNFNKSKNKGQFIFLVVVTITLISSFAAIIGAVPLAFIDFMGGSLIGMRGSLSDFFTILSGALLIGTCFGLTFSLFLSFGVAIGLIYKKWFLILASLGGGLCSGIILFFKKDIFFNEQIPFYGAIYGLFFGFSLMTHFKVSKHI